MKPRHLVGVLICGLLSVYPLSIGPVVAWRYRHGPAPGIDGIPETAAMVEKYYAPILWLTDRVPPLVPVLQYYTEFWMVLEQPSPRAEASPMSP